MGKIIRKVIAVLLVVTALILAVLPASSANATTSTHGDYVYDGNTLVKYLGQEPAVTIPNWITEVGSEAFANNTVLEKIVLPDSVKSIANQAFENCTNLKIVSIPESVKTIGSSAFSGCTKLESISLPAKTEYLGSGVFAGCKSLAQVPIDKANENYTCQDGVIYSKDGSELVQYLAGRPFSAYVMPSSITQIDEYAFWGASNLNKLSMSTGVETIPEYAFDNCDGLHTVALPHSVERINAFAFADCDNLSVINIPDSVGFIDPKAFDMSDGTLVTFVTENGTVLKTVNAKDADEYVAGEEVPNANTNGDSQPQTNSNSDNSNSPSQNLSNDSSDSLNNGDNSSTVASITQNSNGNVNSQVVNVENPTYNGSYSGGSGWINDISSTNYQDNVSPGQIASSVIVGDSAFVMLPSDTTINDGYNLNYAEDEDKYAKTAALYPDASGDETILDSTYCSYNGNSNSVTIPSGITKIGVRAFYANQNISDVTIPTGVEEIGDFAFARSSISSIDIPNGTKTIDYGAFYNCGSLSDVTIPQSVENIELGAFDGTSYLANWKMNPDTNDFLIVGDGILLSYKGSGPEVTVPSNVKSIAAGAFAGNSKIVSVGIPSSVNEIGEEAFNNCTNLKEIRLNEGLYKIHDRAFKNTSVKTLYIPDSVTDIGLGAFDTSDNGSTLETVIFSGKSLPNVSYNDTATRMSAVDLRTRAFEGAENAIIESEAQIDSGTIFDPEHLGFEGQIYSIDNKTNGNTLILERCLAQPDEGGNIIINPRVMIGEESYILDNVKTDAFDSYMNYGKWCDNKPVNITIDGNMSDNLEQLLSETNNNLLSAQDNGEKGIRVNLSSNLFAPGSLANADIPDCKDGFILNVCDNNDDKDALINAYYMAYNTYPDLETTYLSLDLYDKTGTIPIHKLGENKLEVALPVPSALENKNGLKVACLDDNGILTELSCDITEYQGKNYIDFVTGHCSAYMIYSQQIFNIDDSTISVEVEEANSIFTVGNTIWGNLHKEVGGGIEVKWFVIVILLSFAGILFLYKPGKKNNNIN